MDLNWKGLKRLKPSSKRFLFAYKPLAKKWSFGTYTSSTWIVLVSPLRTYYSQLRKSHRRILRDDFWWIDDLLMTSSSVRLLDGEMSESGWGWWPRESFRQERITCQDATQAFNTREMITVDMVCFTKPDTFKPTAVVKILSMSLSHLSPIRHNERTSRRGWRGCFTRSPRRPRGQGSHHYSLRRRLPDKNN